MMTPVDKRVAKWGEHLIPGKLYVNLWLKNSRVEKTPPSMFLRFIIRNAHAIDLEFLSSDGTKFLNRPKDYWDMMIEWERVL